MAFLYALQLPARVGPGNVVLVTTEYENISLLLANFGRQRGSNAGQVAQDAVQQVLAYLNSQAVADEYLGDQLLLPMALAGAGSFTTSTISSHFETNAQIIRKFLPVDIETTPHEYGWLVNVS